MGAYLLGVCYVIPKSIVSLLALAGRLGQMTLASVLGGIVAVCVPVLAFVLGEVVQCLLRSQTAAENRRLSWALPEIAQIVPSSLSPLGQVTALLCLELTLLLIAAALLYFFYRAIQQAAVAFETQLISRLRIHAKALATAKTLSAQQTALTDCLDYHLPRVRSCLSRWWKTFPRHLVQLLSCILLGFLIQPMLCVLTIIAATLVVLVYRFLDRNRRTSLPVVRERAAQQRGELISLSLQGPLLESVHDEDAIDKRFQEQLAFYRRDAVKSLSSSAWKSPSVIVVASLLAALFLFIVSVQVLRAESSFSVAGAFTFSLCFVASALSVMRLQVAFRELRSVETAADALDQFLSIKVEKFSGDDLKAVERVTSVELDHVTLQDSSGRKLLENASAVFKPGILIGVVASQRLQSHALVELLMGFGRPVSGRLLFDGELVTDLKPESVAKCSHWVASDGSLVTGSIQENLEPVSKEAAVNLKDVIIQTKLAEAIQQLPDGLQTLVTPGDDRLRGDSAFRIGLARAALTKASIVVVEEPIRHFDAESEQQSLDAIRSLVSHSAITVVLPQRLLTLRQCDCVVMLHEHTVEDTGTHAELLQRNEFYRHLNYLRFNPFGGVAE